MRRIIKNMMIYSLLVAITQFGLNTSTLEASPRSDWQQQKKGRQALEYRQHNQEMQRRINENAQEWNDRQWLENQQHERYARRENERQYQNELEMQRHEGELLRRDYENDQEWNDRQWLENQTHEEMIRQIEENVSSNVSK